MSAQIPFGSRPLSVAFALVAVVMAGLTVTVSSIFGASLALDPLDKWVQALSSVSVDLFGFTLAFGVGMLIKYRRYLPALLSALALLLYVGYSMQSVVGFGSVARVAKDNTIKAQVAAEKNAVQEQNGFAAELKTKTIEWMQGTAYVRAQKKEREQLLKEIRDEASKPLDMKVSHSEGIVGDPQAEMIAHLLGNLGVTPSSWQITQVVWLAVLLVGGKVLGSFFAGYFWPARQDAGAAQHQGDAKASKQAGLASASPDKPEPPPPAARAPVHEPDDDIVEDVKDSPEMDKATARWIQIKAFRASATYIDPEEANTSTRIYTHYVAWCSRTGVPQDDVMSHNRFGRINTTIHARSANGDMRRPWYVGVGLIPLDECGEVSLAYAA